jgi:large subunit ribosomal protein L24
LMLICPFTEKPTRVWFVNIKAKWDAKWKKFRYSKKALKEKWGEAKDYIVK